MQRSTTLGGCFHQLYVSDVIMEITCLPFWWSADKEDPSACASCMQVLEELENIDDDTDRIGVSFVKTQDLKVAERYGVTTLPALLYFEHQIPTVYEGQLNDKCVSLSSHPLLYRNSLLVWKCKDSEV